MTQRKIFNGITVLVTYLLIILLLILITEVHAQQSRNGKVYQMKITTKEGLVKKGYLLGVQDSIILLNTNPYVNHPFEIKADQVKTIRIHRKGGVWRGAAIGAGVGALAGYIIGYAAHQEPDCDPGSFFCIDFGPEYSGLSGMSIGFLIGGGIGALAGASSKKFELNGNQNSFQLIRPELSKYQIIYDPSARDQVNK